MRSLSHSGPILVLVDGQDQPPVQAVLDAPMLLNDLIDSLGRQDSTELVGSFGRGLVRRFARSNYIANGLNARALVLFLQPVDLG